jgi:hypothetical protein
VMSIGKDVSNVKAMSAQLGDSLYHLSGLGAFKAIQVHS